MPVDLARADAIAYAFVRTAKTLSGMRSRLPKPAEGVDHSTYPVLFRLTAGPARISKLAEAVGSDISTVSRQVAQLLDGGLAVRTPDPDDGRASLIELTEAGHETVERSREQRALFFQQVLADWTPEEAEALATGLEHVYASLHSTLTSAGVQVDDA